MKALHHPVYFGLRAKSRRKEVQHGELYDRL
jgi:hypothetical protein